MDALTVSNLFLWLAVIALGIVVLALARQIGVLHERIPPAGALALSGGIKPGETVPDLDLLLLDGTRLRLGASAARARGLLFFFVSPTCPVCKALLPVVQRIADEERGWLDLVLASDGGSREEHERYVQAQRIGDRRYTISRDLGVALQVGKLPYAALVDARGVLVAKGLVNSREHVESLLEAHRLGVSSINEYLGRSAAETPHQGKREIRA